MAGPSLCECATLVNVAAPPELGRCLIVCGTEIPAKHVLCRPCAKGNHTGQPCRTPERESSFPLVKTCRVCGFDLAEHREEDFR